MDILQVELPCILVDRCWHGYTSECSKQYCPSEKRFAVVGCSSKTKAMMASYFWLKEVNMK